MRFALDLGRLEVQERQGQLSHLCSVSKSRNMLNEVIIPFCVFKTSQFSKPIINFHINLDNIQLNEMTNLPKSFVGTDQVLLSKFSRVLTVTDTRQYPTQTDHNYTATTPPQPPNLRYSKMVSLWQASALRNWPGNRRFAIFVAAFLVIVALIEVVIREMLAAILLTYRYKEVQCFITGPKYR
jgi:hypothetical protein